MSHHKTLTNLRDAVRDNLDETTASFWSAADIDRYINRAKDRVWMEVRKLKKDYFTVTRTSTDGSLTILGETYAATGFQVVASTRDYTLPPDFSEMTLVEVTTSGYETVKFFYRDLAAPEMRAALMITDNQTPDVFYFGLIAERTMRIAPMSDTTLNLRLTYVQAFPDLSLTTDELTMPFPLYLAVEAYATASAMKKDRNPAAAVWEQTGNSYVANVFGGHARQTQDPVFVSGAFE